MPDAAPRFFLLRMKKERDPAVLRCFSPSSAPQPGPYRLTAAHATCRLMLLGSPPDMVHGHALRGTGEGLCGHGADDMEKAAGRLAKAGIRRSVSVSFGLLFYYIRFFWIFQSVQIIVDMRRFMPIAANFSLVDDSVAGTGLRI